MARFDGFTSLTKEEKAEQADLKDDFDRHDWEKEVADMERERKYQYNNLHKSPFHWKTSEGGKWHW